MWTNKTYLHLQGNNLIYIWKADVFFITFDLETVESIHEENDKNNNTKILSTLSTLSVATAYHMRKGDVVTHHDINKDGEDFLKIWMRELIKYSKEIYDDNLYRDLNTEQELKIPKNKEVAILGYNSGRFDLNLIYKHLHNPPEWEFYNMTGDLTHFKQIRVMFPINPQE
jgi:hypothetical protein